MKKLICTIIAISCALTIWSAAGASDLNLIGPLEALLKGTIGLTGLFVSARIGGII